MNTHRISVSVDKTGIKVAPETLIMTSQDEVHWGCKTAHRFSIEFDGATPFAVASLDHDKANAKQRPKNQGRFKYTVVLESDPSVRLDPVIIVDPPPTHPGP
jgi:hypothetical protein